PRALDAGDRDERDRGDREEDDRGPLGVAAGAAELDAAALDPAAAAEPAAAVAPAVPRAVVRDHDLRDEHDLRALVDGLRVRHAGAPDLLDHAHPLAARLRRRRR